MKRRKGEHRIKNVVGSVESYRLYKESTGSKVSKKLYTNICHRFNQELSKLILYDNFEFKIPFRLGFLRIKAFKQKIRIVNGRLAKNKLKPDWNATIEMYQEKYPEIKGRKNMQKHISKLAEEAKKRGENITLLYHFNEHTEGYIHRWHWDRRFCNCTNNSIYLFRPTKQNRLNLAKYIKSSENVNYYR